MHTFVGFQLAVKILSLFGRWRTDTIYRALSTQGKALPMDYYYFLFLAPFFLVVIFGWLPDYLKRRYTAKRSKKEAFESILDLHKNDSTQDIQNKINKTFDAKKGKIEVTQDYRDEQDDWRTAYSFSRELAIMKPVERESLRSLFIFSNSGFIEDQRFVDLITPLIWGEKGAEINSYRVYSSRKSDRVPTFKTGNEIIPWLLERKYLGYESTISSIVGMAQRFAEKNPDNPSIMQVYNRMHTGGNWLEPTDIANTIYDVADNEKYYVSLGLMENGEPLKYSGNEAIATIAPPGAGKSQCQVIPNLINWQGAAIVLDIKGELYEQTAAVRKQRYGAVYKFNIYEDDTDCFNPFDFLSNDPDELLDDAAFMASMLILPSGKDEFWDTSARDQLLRPIIAAMLLKGEKLSFEYILDCLASREDLEGVVYTLENSDNSALVRASKNLKEMLLAENKRSGNTLSNIIQTAVASLGKLEGKRIQNATRKTDWTPEKLREENATLYIILKPGQVDQYAPLLRLVFGLHQRKLMEKLPKAGATPILLMLDEMPQLRYMRPVEDAIDLGRQYGLRLWIFVQATGQIKKHYTDAGEFLSKCAIKCYMNPTMADNEAQKISEALGTRESILDGKTVPLVEAPELTGADYVDKVIVIGKGAKPAKLSKDYAYENERLQTIIAKEKLTETNEKMTDPII